MASSYIVERSRQTRDTREITFRGDAVRLAGQMDYPRNIPPSEDRGTYPLLFVLHSAGWGNRSDYAHYAKIGLRSGYAVFRWDKRCNGRSGGSGRGSTTMDAVNAYENALDQPHINNNHVVILAQGEGTLMLAENFGLFARIQSPTGVLLIANMLDASAINAIAAPTQIINGENDWHDWRVYGREASISHKTCYSTDTHYYMADGANRMLMIEDGGRRAFHPGAKLITQEWLQDLCRRLP